MPTLRETPSLADSNPLLIGLVHPTEPAVGSSGILAPSPTIRFQSLINETGVIKVFCLF